MTPLPAGHVSPQSRAKGYEKNTHPRDSLCLVAVVSNSVGAFTVEPKYNALSKNGLASP